MYRNDVDTFDVLSCTDIQCSWRKPQKDALKQYDPHPLENHPCYAKSFNESKNLTISAEQEEKIKQLIFSKQDSAIKLFE